MAIVKYRSRRAVQELQSKVLDITATLTVASLVYYQTQWFNPWNLTGSQWAVGGLMIRGAILFYDHLVVMVVEWCATRSSSNNSSSSNNNNSKNNSSNNKNNNSNNQHLLPTRRATEKPVRFVTLDYKSLVFLTINSIHEWIFVQRLCHYIWYSPLIPKGLSDLHLLNTLGALYVMFVVLDACYAPSHHILHMPFWYPLVHKHHHRQHFPTRGYLDAGNEHPIEHVVGVSCTWAAVLGAVHTTGAHAGTVFLFFNIHAALAMLNHSPYNVRWNILGLQYSVANHEMHHRKFTVNYAQYCMWYDHGMNTYADYEGPNHSSSSIGTSTSRVAAAAS